MTPIVISSALCKSRLIGGILLSLCVVWPLALLWGAEVQPAGHTPPPFWVFMIDGNTWMVCDDDQGQLQLFSARAIREQGAFRLRLDQNIAIPLDIPFASILDMKACPWHDNGVWFACLYRNTDGDIVSALAAYSTSKNKWHGDTSTQLVFKDAAKPSLLPLVWRGGDRIQYDILCAGVKAKDGWGNTVSYIDSCPASWGLPMSGEISILRANQERTAAMATRIESQQHLPTQFQELVKIRKLEPHENDTTEQP